MWHTGSESVTGLEVSSIVRYQGVPVGRVSSIGFAKDEFPQIDVVVELDPTAPLRTDTTASLKPHDVLEASADPEQSDFELSDERWTFHAEDGGTTVRYYLRMKPAFWVPPVIGPYMIQKKLGKKGDDALDRIEKIAQEWVTPDE